MPDFSASGRVPAAATTVTVPIQHNRAGLVWVVSMLATESIPLRQAGNAKLYRNGRFLTSTAQLPATAQGEPFIKLNASDRLDVVFANLVAGDTAIVTASYNETEWGIYEPGSVV